MIVSYWICQNFKKFELSMICHQKNDKQIDFQPPPTSHPPAPCLTDALKWWGKLVARRERAGEASGTFQKGTSDNSASSLKAEKTKRIPLGEARRDPPGAAVAIFGNIFKPQDCQN